MTDPIAQRRRRGDISADAGPLERVLKSPLFDRVAYAVIAAIVGGSASLATTKVEDASHQATVSDTREKVLALEAELDRRAKSLGDRLRREEAEREQRERDVEARARVLDVYLERRLATIEAHLQITAPPAPAIEAPARRAEEDP